MSCHAICGGKAYTKDDANEPFLNLVKRISDFTYVLSVYQSVIGPCILFKNKNIVPFLRRSFQTVSYLAHLSNVLTLRYVLIPL